MKREKLKTPNDYEIFSFRITQDQKDRLSAKINDVVELYNKKKSDDLKKFRKNDIIMEALDKGLELMKRNRGR